MAPEAGCLVVMPKVRITVIETKLFARQDLSSRLEPHVRAVAARRTVALGTPSIGVSKVAAPVRLPLVLSIYIGWAWEHCVAKRFVHVVGPEREAMRPIISAVHSQMCCTPCDTSLLLRRQPRFLSPALPATKDEEVVVKQVAKRILTLRNALSMVYAHDRTGTPTTQREGAALAACTLL